MNRRRFIKSCSAICFAGAVSASLLEGCATGKDIVYTESDSRFTIPVAAFAKGKPADNMWKQYVVVRPSKLKFPICVFRSDAGEYSALLMQCTHRGCELENAGDHLSCPCHGSEFDAKGTVLNPPAEANLNAFPVSVINDKVIIQLN